MTRPEIITTAQAATRLRVDSSRVIAYTIHGLQTPTGGRLKLASSGRGPRGGRRYQVSAVRAFAAARRALGL